MEVVFAIAVVMVLICICRLEYGLEKGSLLQVTVATAVLYQGLDRLASKPRDVNHETLLWFQSDDESFAVFGGQAGTAYTAVRLRGCGGGGLEKLF